MITFVRSLEYNKQQQHSYFFTFEDCSPKFSCMDIIHRHIALKPLCIPYNFFFFNVDILEKCPTLCLLCIWFGYVFFFCFSTFFSFYRLSLCRAFNLLHRCAFSHIRLFSHSLSLHGLSGFFVSSHRAKSQFFDLLGK